MLTAVDDLVSGFSRGMRQRVALERALLHDPRLVLLDEPFTGLDQASTAALVARLRERQAAGCIIVIATHDLDVADGLLSRAIYLKNGRIVGTDAGQPRAERALPAGDSMIGSFFRVAWHVMRKDLTVEVRSKEVLLTTLFFAVSVVLVFSFAIVREGRAPDDVAAGILWVAVSFSGTLAMGRTFERERYNDTLRALLLAPADRPAIYTGKLLGLLVLLGLVEIVLVPLVGLLFNAPILAFPGRLAGLAGLWGPSGLPRSARSSPPCWFGFAAGIRCCRCCCIPSPFP